MSIADPDEILRFWFEELSPKDWFRKDPELDARIAARFGSTHEALSRKIPEDWLGRPEGCLAAIIVLDQFCRNMFRETPRAFATDAAALALSKRAIAKGFDMTLDPDRRAFLYMPFQHSENPADQARSVELFTALDKPVELDFARRHKAIIDRFGRFPHRNAILGRASTEEESAFLLEPGSSF
jgi:uncharacterized protein (DUF924 family)